jgi:hypothetical protein
VIAALATMATASSAGAAQPNPNADAFGPAAHTHLSPGEAFGIASRTPAARAASREFGVLRAGVCAPGTPACHTGCWPGCREQWQVLFVDRGGVERAEVRVEDRTGVVSAAWAGIPLHWPIARGIPGFLGHHVNALYVWIPLCVLFVAPFVDLRHPFRRLHWDLLALLGFSVSQVFFNRGDLELSVPFVYPVLAYLLVRLVLAGLRPRRGPGPLVAHVRLPALAFVLVCLVVLRVGLNLADSTVTDIGGDTAQVATRLAAGHVPYSGSSTAAYGPVAYLAYLPFAAVWPSVTRVIPGEGRYRGATFVQVRNPAAHAAAIFFDLLTMLGLFAVGRRLRAGREGTVLGVALAYGWASYPYTLFALSSNTNDAVVSALLVAGLLAFSLPRTRTGLVGLAAAAKLAPGVLIPLFVLADGRQRVRRLAEVALVAGAVGGATVALVAPSVLTNMVNIALFQLRRSSPFSMWGRYPTISWLHVAAFGGAIGLALLVAVVPRVKRTAQVAALGAAVLVATEISLPYWFYFYIVWFVPFTLVALFTEHAGDGDLLETAPSSRLAGTPG